MQGGREKNEEKNANEEVRRAACSPVLYRICTARQPGATSQGSPVAKAQRVGDICRHHLPRDLLHRPQKPRAQLLAGPAGSTEKEGAGAWSSRRVNVCKHGRKATARSY